MKLYNLNMTRSMNKNNKRTAERLGFVGTYEEELKNEMNKVAVLIINLGPSTNMTRLYNEFVSINLRYKNLIRTFYRRNNEMFVVVQNNYLKAIIEFREQNFKE